ncbi:Tol-Pal system beta propeller repeat protein TolB [Candidatus Puniceispirillum sp.]|nr:Tol-Pal system beta propeller repeat protein TolB [Candidatus Puniceispirillum sp.]
MTKDLLMQGLIVFRAKGFILLSSFFLLFSLFSPPTNAQLQFNITDGQVAPTPIAVANFTNENGEISDVGKQIAQIISSDLESSGLFRPVDTAAFIAPPAAPTVRPNFANWTPLGVKGLLVGSAQFGEVGKTLVEFVLWDVVTGEPIASAEGEADRNGIRRIAHQIADFVYEEFTGDIGYFDTRVVYVAESGSQSRRLKRLAIMDQDGHNHQYLTSGADLVLTPRFSPTANEIAYLNYFNDEPNVYLFEIATGRTERLGSFPGMTFAPRFAPSGDKLIMSLAQNGMTDIYEMDMRTQAINRLTYSASIDTSPSYSPDGKKIVFNSDRGGSQQLYVMDADGDNVQRVSFNQGRYATPVWSPRGDVIAFTKMANGQFYIGVMKVDGSGERLLAKGFLVEGPTWAPNGRVLMYFKQQPFEADGSGGDTHVYRIDITGFNEKRIITPSDASDPAWSPALR